MKEKWSIKFPHRSNDIPNFVSKSIELISHYETIKYANTYENTILPHIKISPFINAKRASPTFTHRGTKEKEGWFYSWVEVVVLHFHERLLDGKDGTRAFFRIDIYVYISALGSLVIFLSPRRRIFMREGTISRPIRCFGARFLIDVEKLSGRRIDWWLFW